jgi:squalene synthase HpnC
MIRAEAVGRLVGGSQCVLELQVREAAAVDAIAVPFRCVSVLTTDISRFGPTQTEVVGLDAARAYCRGLTLGRYENFSVLSPLVPADCRDDFAAVYAFCRWADDLGDEAGSPERATELLAWWRGELDRLEAGEARHPVFIALRATIAARGLSLEPFRDLVRAFELDQVKSRYATWDEVIDYCKLSANPVGRIVLALLGERCDDTQLAASDAVCTALQLTNHWQDIKRDWVERRRVYVPSDMHDIQDFEARLDQTVGQGWSSDSMFFAESRRLVRRLVARTWDVWESGEPLVSSVSPRARPLIWLFAAGGRSVLRNIERWNCETVLERPKLSKPRKIWLVARAVTSARMGWRLPALPGPSMWIVDPEPDPDAAKFPKRSAHEATSDATSASRVDDAVTTS